MIADTLDRAEHYYALHPLFRAGFDYLRRFTPDITDERHALDGDLLFALPQSYQTAPAADKRFEAHRRYIDIQYLHAGEEALYHAPIGDLQLTDPYNAERDLMFFRDPAAPSRTVLRPGQFVIYFPHDGHKGGCQVTAPSSVRKVVLKVAV